MPGETPSGSPDALLPVTSKKLLMLMPARSTPVGASWATISGDMAFALREHFSQAFTPVHNGGCSGRDEDIVLRPSLPLGNDDRARKRGVSLQHRHHPFREYPHVEFSLVGRHAPIREIAHHVIRSSQPLQLAQFLNAIIR